jgi:exosome complex component RRP4
MLLIDVNLLLQLERGNLLTVSPYLVKRRKQHFHHLEQYDVDLILGCNGFIWVGEHVVVEDNDKISKTGDQKLRTEPETFTALETRKHICRIANAIRVLSDLGFTLTVELIIETAEASASSIEINDMLGAEFYVQTAEREAKCRADLLKKNNRAR